ncbi:MAG: D-alanyl-D-alanine carboxypeptidase family protein [Patescibacteria group bacterium]
MSNGKTVILNILLFAGIVVLGTFIFADKSDANFKPVVKGFVDQRKISPEEKYINSKLKNFTNDNSWEPKVELGTVNQPEIAAEAGMLVDINTGNILFEKNANERRKIASLVKIMTAVLSLEHKSLNDKVYVTANASSVGENSMGISEGEVYTIEELLYGLILHSGNDAAYALAEGTAGDAETFVFWMNLKARELGLKDTYFTDPSGLNDDTYSTPADLVKLTKYALENEDFKKIVSTVEKELSGNTHKYLHLYNQTNLLASYPGVAGVKTGYTEEAGLCLVTYASNENKEVVGVVLKSIDRKGDMILMLDHSYATLGINIEHNLL